MRLAALKNSAEIRAEGMGHQIVWTEQREAECKLCGSSGFISLKPIQFKSYDEKTFYHGVLFHKPCEPPKSKANQLLTDLTKKLDSYYDIGQ